MLTERWGKFVLLSECVNLLLGEFQTEPQLLKTSISTTLASSEVSFWSTERSASFTSEEHRDFEGEEASGAAGKSSMRGFLALLGGSMAHSLL